MKNNKEIKLKQESRKKFLAKVKQVFERKYGRELSEDTVEQIANSLTQFACISHNVYSKLQGKKPIYKV